MPWTSLSLDELRLGLTDLLQQRTDAFSFLSQGSLYQQLLADVLADLTAESPQNTALVDQLAIIDDRHDSIGRAIWSCTGAYMDNPLVSPQQRMAAVKIRQAFVPSLGELHRSYAQEAARTDELQGHLEELFTDLHTIPVGQDQSLYTWASAFVEEARALARLLGNLQSCTIPESADNQPIIDRAIELLGNLRTAVQQELAERPELPRDLEEQLLAGFQALIEANRAA